MIVISNSSPLIALSRIRKLDILKQLFGKIYIPESVYQEVVLQSTDRVQTESLLQGIYDSIHVEQPIKEYVFTRSLDAGERGVLNLAYEKQAALLLIDDKKARNEAKEHGFRVVKTSTLLKRSEQQHIISSYSEIVQELQLLRIYLP